MANANKNNIKKRQNLTRPLTGLEVDANFQELVNVIEDQSSFQSNQTQLNTQVLAELEKKTKSLDDLTGLQNSDNFSAVVYVKNYYTSGFGSGGFYVYNPLKAKTLHNGGTIISPTVPWNGQETSLAGFLNGSGETQPSGLGVWERIDASSKFFNSAYFGLVSNTPSTHSISIQKAIEECYKYGGGEVFLPHDVTLGSPINLYPNVRLVGTGQSECRVEKSFTGGTMIQIMRPSGYVPSLAIAPEIKHMTIVSDNNTIAIDLSECRGARVEDVEVANALIGISFNKKSYDEGLPFDGQTYFAKVYRCAIASCVTGIKFYGAANRNTFELNTYTNCDVAIDFSTNNNVSETNVFNNENIEGCKSAFEWGTNIFTQTFLGVTVENPTTNPFTCLVKDPGRQNFIGLALIPSNNVATLDFFTLAGKKPSVLVGSRGSSSGFSYGIRLSEDVRLYGVINNYQGGEELYTGNIAAGASDVITFSVPDAGNGDLVKVVADKDLQGAVLSGWVSGTGQVSVRIQNASGGNISLSNVLIRATVERLLI